MRLPDAFHRFKKNKEETNGIQKSECGNACGKQGMSATLQIAADTFLSLPHEEQVGAMVACRDLDLLAELDVRLYAMCGHVNMPPTKVDMFTAGGDVVSRLSGSLASEMFACIAEDLINGHVLDDNRAMRLRQALLAANHLLGLAPEIRMAA